MAARAAEAAPAPFVAGAGDPVAPAAFVDPVDVTAGADCFCASADGTLTVEAGLGAAGSAVLVEAAGFTAFWEPDA